MDEKSKNELLKKYENLIISGLDWLNKNQHNSDSIKNVFNEILKVSEQINKISSFVNLIQENQPNSNFFKIINSLNEIDFENFKSHFKSSVNLSPNEYLLNQVTARLFKNLVDDSHNFLQRLDYNYPSKLLLNKYILKLKDQFEFSQIEDALAHGENEAIFIESGTTLALVSLALIDKYSQGYIAENANTSLNLCTNNAIISRFAESEEFVNSVLLPGKPRNKYGATYGDYKNSEKCDVKKVIEFFEGYNVKTIFSTASYLDIQYGTHVSSQANLLMKNTCNSYVLDKKNTCKDIFIIASESINNDISNNLVDPNCLLIFQPNSTKNIKELGHDKEDARSRFRHYLQESNFLILTGSVDSDICEDAVEQFLSVHGTYLERKYFDIPKSREFQNGGKIAAIYRNG